MNFHKLMTTTSAVVLLAAAPAVAQMYEGYDSGLGYEGFQTGLGDAGYYDAWDSNDDLALGENEFATGIYSDWDNDDEFGINEAEYDVGVGRWYGDDYTMTFSDYDVDGSGLIDQNEFGANWDSNYFASWDGDGNSELSDMEYSQGIYNMSDRDQDLVISIEEEGWFEGWFDGDDIEAEITTVGEVF